MQRIFFYMLGALGSTRQMLDFVITWHVNILQR